MSRPWPNRFGRSYRLPRSSLQRARPVYFLELFHSFHSFLGVGGKDMG
jgi:hypothetical protein